jgi:hypothetical protein
MRRHKEGIRENDGVMVHPLGGEAWNVLDIFDANFVGDIRNVRFCSRLMALINSLQTLHHTFVGLSLLCRTTYHHLFI